jgi:hypothetical protein
MLALLNVNSRSGFQPRVARLKSTKIVSRATRGSRFYPFVELTLLNGEMNLNVTGLTHFVRRPESFGRRCTGLARATSPNCVSPV